MRLAHEAAEVAHGAVMRIDRAVIGDVVTIVAQRRGIKWHDPDRGRAQLADIIEPAGQAFEIADAVAIRILE